MRMGFGVAANMSCAHLGLPKKTREKRRFVTLELIQKEPDVEPPFPLGPRTSCPLRAVKARSAATTVNAGRFQIEPS
jgi:hypothetical protein